MNTPAIEIRTETTADVQAIHDVTQRAFAGRPYAAGDEQDVIDRLRAIGALHLSLVATDGGQLIGQITFSPATLHERPSNWYALGPVSVEPERQSEGIGGMLINAGLERLQREQAAGCILTGNPAYYQRFGFALAPAHVPDNESVDHFMVKILQGELPEGRFAFHPAFYGPV